MIVVGEWKSAAGWVEGNSGAVCSLMVQIITLLMTLDAMTTLFNLFRGGLVELDMTDNGQYTSWLPSAASSKTEVTDLL